MRDVPGLADGQARRTHARVWIALFACVGIVSGVTAIVAALVLVGGVAAVVVASILPTLGLIRAVNLSSSTPASAVLAVAAAVAVSMLVTKPGAIQFGVAALLFMPVAAGEAVRWARRQITP